MNLTIIIVSWNAKEYLFKCLRSITQTVASKHFDIIVVDNASSDGSPQMVIEQYPQVKLVRNSINLGFAGANNMGIRASKGKYLALINSDVEIMDACLDNLYKYMETHPDIGMLGPQILDSKGAIQRSCMGFPTLWNTFCRALTLDTMFPKIKLFGGNLMTYWPHNTVKDVDVINGCFWMVRRDALNQVGMLDERFFMYAEDKDWCKRFNSAGWRVVYYPEAKAKHYGGASSSNSPIRFYLEMYRANMQYWKKHYSCAAQIGFVLISITHQVLRLLIESIQYAVRKARRKETLFKIRRSTACIKWILSFNYEKRISFDK